MESSNVACTATNTTYSLPMEIQNTQHIETTQKSYQSISVYLKYNFLALCHELPWEILSWLVILIKILSKSERKVSQCCIVLFNLPFREKSITSPFWLLLLKCATITSFHSLIRNA